MAKQPWKAWHEVVRLREDLRSGDLPLHMFAADLYEVMCPQCLELVAGACRHRANSMGKRP